jgi:hypothetical protein
VNFNPCSTHGIQIWKFQDAPEAFRSLSVHEGGEEFVLYVPPDSLGPDGELNADDNSLWFLDWRPKHEGHVQYAGDRWGWYSLKVLPDGGLLAITTESRG